MTVPRAFVPRLLLFLVSRASGCACATALLWATGTAQCRPRPTTPAPHATSSPSTTPATTASTTAATTTSADLGLKAIESLLRGGHYLDAENAARRHLADVERLYGAGSLQAAAVLDKLAEALRLGGKAATPEAAAICDRALAIKERALPSDDPDLAASLHNLGALHLTNGDYAAARPLLERVLAIRVHAYGENNIEVARSLLFLANLEFSVGSDAKAKPYVERAVAIHEKILPPGDPERARALNMLGAIAYDALDFVAADSLMSRVLEIQTTALGKDHPLLGETLQNLGSLRGEMGDYGEAERYLLRALDIRRKKLGPRHPLVAFTLMSLGRNDEAQGRVLPAILRFREALQIQDQTAPGHPDAGWMRARLGHLEASRGNDRQARSLLERGLAIQEKALGKEHPDLAWTLLDLAQVEARGRDLSRATEHCARALSIQERALGRTHPDVTHALALRAELCAASGDTAGAFDSALEATRIRTDHLALTAAGFAERQALAYAAIRPSPLAAPLSLVASRSDAGDTVAVARTWDALIRSRTIVLDEMAARYRAAFSAIGDATLAAGLGDLRRASQRYANRLVRGPGDSNPKSYQDAVAVARSDVERAERAIRQRGGTLQRAPMGLSDMRSAMPPHWGMVAFAEYEDPRGFSVTATRRIAALVLTPAGRVSAVDLGPSARLERAIQRWTANVLSAPRDVPASGSSAEAACRSAGTLVRAAVWDPIRARLAGADGVFIIPDGALNRVALAGLPDPRGGYLVEKGPIFHYLSAERDVVTAQGLHANGKGLLALGAPAFDGPQPLRGQPDTRRGSHTARGGCGEFDRIRFRPLPETLKEVTEIARSWAGRNDVLVLTGEQAAESAFKKLAPGREVVHLATHGFFLDSASCLPAPAAERGIGIISTVGPRPTGRPSGGGPLLLSGLALAGANRRNSVGPDAEDGILTAEEVASVNLNGVSWVVLSACDTGLGRVQASEGVVGLRRAFSIAGAGTLMMSLWSIEDRSAREWMEHLYSERFTKGLSTADAVRQASLDVLRERRAQSRSTHPFYWAAFVAVGDWK